MFFFKILKPLGLGFFVNPCLFPLSDSCDSFPGILLKEYISYEAVCLERRLELSLRTVDLEEAMFGLQAI